MLSKLYIENIAVIERVEIEFSKGLNVLTGETGAGKSILLDSISAVLGERTSRDLIRTGEQTACVTAEFTDIGKSVTDMLEGLGIETEDGVLMLSRELSLTGRGGFRINGRPTSGSILRELGSKLINIHGQHDNQALLDQASHLRYIDLMTDGGLIEEFSALYGEYTQAQEEFSKFCIDVSTKQRRVDLLNYRVAEIEDADLSVGELAQLLDKRRMYQNFERIANGLCEADACLYGDENSSGGVGEIATASEILCDMEDLYPQILPISKRFLNILYELKDAASELHEMSYNMEYDPSALEEIENRIELLKKIVKKYGSEEAALRFLRKAKQELSDLENFEEHNVMLEEKRDKALEAALAAAKKLSLQRQKAAQDFCDRVGRELSYLDMPYVSLSAFFEEKELSSDGVDKAEFLISVNPGEAPRPLVKVASGGELSRIMLAIKNVLSEKDDIDTLIFDEIDTGISGRAAQKVGEKLLETSRSRQLICVTHLAQIAACADNHLYIEKNIENGRTCTNVTSLEREGRVRELARINGGGSLTEAMLLSAQELLDISRGKKADN
ncbi:MAG: DNA repair protein RecN [Ruminococcaceae bacterium]|nr:DNA repair protein RecN [Oscillospiraceae bacterium]